MAKRSRSAVKGYGKEYPYGPLTDVDERRTLFAALDSFRQYRKNAHYNITHRRRQNLYALPHKQWQMLAAPPFNLLETLNLVDDAIDVNADLAVHILHTALHAFGLPENPDPASDVYWVDTAGSGDINKAQSTIRQFYRDWSSEGFKFEVLPILQLIFKGLQIWCTNPVAETTILLPGAGLGRLLLELVLAGYNVEGNEISYHQLMASNFVLNATARAEQYELFPFVNVFTNHLSREDQLARVSIPDVHPATTIAKRAAESGTNSSAVGQMNMTAGDFITAYSSLENQGSFDAVVTVYFIDTAPNLIRYVETINHCLREGGIWINIGPLLWHFDDRISERVQHTTTDDKELKSHPQTIDQIKEDIGIGEPGSFELTEEEVILLIKKNGFEVLSHEQLPEEFGEYIQNRRSMVQNLYRCSHWIARKTANTPAEVNE